MSSNESIKAAAEWAEAKQQMALALTVMSTTLAVAQVLNGPEVDDVKVRGIKALIRGTRAYSAGMLGISDQMTAEMKQINKDRGKL